MFILVLRKLFKHKEGDLTMSIFSFRKKEKTQPEFVKDPEAFIQFLRKDDEELIKFGQTALIAAGEEVIHPLINLLTNEQEDKKVRRRIGTVLSRIQKPAITPLLEVLKEQGLKSKSSSETIGIIAAALGGIGKQAVEPLIRALDSKLRHVRFGAAIALVQTGEVEAIEAVRKAAVHGDTGDREMFKMVLEKENL